MIPTPMRAVIGWQEGRWIKSDRSKQGWVLQTDAGLLGPGDLFVPGKSAEGASAVLEVAGQSVALSGNHKALGEWLALLDERVTENVWPSSKQRPASEPEDCLVFADPASKPLPLAATRLSGDDGMWQIDSALGLDEAWHGAPVIARSDGKLVGVMLIENDTAKVALLPQK